MFANKFGLAGLVLGMLFSPLGLASDVKVYDKAPSVEELQKQLTGDSVPGRSKPRTRAIVFGDASPAPQDTAPAQQEASTDKPTAAAPQQPRPQQTQSQGQAQASASAGQQPMQVSVNAIAFPINFRVNSADIMGESIPFLESIAGLLQKDANIRLLVEGHTDSSGAATRNNTLSRERAYSVVNYLIDRYRIDPARLIPIGKSFSEPLEGLDASNPKNRRVQFRVIG